MKKSIKLIIWLTIVVIVLIALLSYWHHEKIYPSTDDAYVQAHVVHIAAQVNGPVAKIYVDNNQQVKQGQPLLDIDPKPFEIAVQRAQAQLSQARNKMLSSQQAVNSAEAMVVEKASQLDVTKKNSARTLILVGKGQMTKEAGDDARNDVQVAQAALNAAKSQLAQAKAELGKLGSQNANIREAAAQLAQAKLDLQHTHITAPTSGKLVNFDMRVGSMIQAQQNLFDLINEKIWWVDANFKETQLERIRNDQTASVELDMYPDHQFIGKVQSISSGSGAAFSMLPPENATGNWVKVTQRFPVKVIIKNTDPNYPLRVGASATVTVDTR